ncbi:F0F1 ATP synthase subunit gamma [Desulfopila sp. IMCC35008]|uniref:F0F1 ATP synthase subunit gamma n=1 Tax=Desulfopila sp. IMCC35008 TaxID=2653858 RepID=UPI0013D13C9F|nr:F0F1 ATP synthase subunit gamma [Desulfopila sp. IMCC35008]
MSRYRKVELHLSQLRELQSIITSMKTLSQLELRKLSRLTRSHSGMVEVLEQTVIDFLTYFPRPPTEKDNTIWLLVGSERGLCGGFNELLVDRLFHEWPECVDKQQRVLAVGHKLCRRLDEMLPGHEGIAGACASEEITSLLSRVVRAAKKQLMHHNSVTLRVLYHSDEHRKMICRQLLPPEGVRVSTKRTFPPLLYLDPETFFSKFLQHYLFLGLTQLISDSLMVENRYRTQHLGGAIRRLDERLTILNSRARSLRQEEITEEIEMIILGSGVFDFPHKQD